MAVVVMLQVHQRSADWMRREALPLNLDSPACAITRLRKAPEGDLWLCAKACWVSNAMRPSMEAVTHECSPMRVTALLR